MSENDENILRLCHMKTLDLCLISRKFLQWYKQCSYFDDYSYTAEICEYDGLISFFSRSSWYQFVSTFLLLSIRFHLEWGWKARCKCPYCAYKTSPQAFSIVFNRCNCHVQQIYKESNMGFKIVTGKSWRIFKVISSKWWINSGNFLKGESRSVHQRDDLHSTTQNMLFSMSIVYRHDI